MENRQRVVAVGNALCVCVQQSGRDPACVFSLDAGLGVCIRSLENPVLVSFSTVSR